MEILVTSQQIRDKIRWVLGDAHDERIVLVAFVGHDAVKFLDNPKGIQLYCWLKPSGTNPNGLRGLLGKEVELFAVENLHMKLYWSRKRGAVLGSANLSENALQNGVQLELAAYFPPKIIDVRRLMKRFEATPTNDPEIDEFEKKYNLYHLRNPNEALPRSRYTSRTPNYLEWRKTRQKSRKAQFNLYWWSEEAAPPQDALQALRQNTGSEKHVDYIVSRSKNLYQRGAWVLSFREKRSQNGAIRPVSIEWFIPQEYAMTKKRGWHKHIWFQTGKQLPAVHFNLNDSIFRQALAKVLIDNGNDIRNVVIKNSTRPTEEFLHSLEQKYREVKLARE
jgi:hypothetical protein